MKMIISLGQMDVVLGDPQANFGRVQSMTAEAARRGSDLVLFPELWSTGYDLENWGRHATGLEAGLFPRLAALARQHGIALGGSLLEAGDGHAFNTFTLFGPDGDLLASYRKVHLFRLMDEDRWLGSGERLELLEAPWGTTGLTICYDLRFPEMFRAYALGGARLVLLVAEWPARRSDHWRTLLRARAIENQVYIAAVNRVGTSKDETFGGHSALIDPWGATIVEGGETEILLTGELDLSRVADIRTHIPVFEDRRPEVYAAPPRKP